MTDKPTMAAIWEEFTPEERELMTKMVNPNADQGSLALMKISTVLKAIAYRYMDREVVDKERMLAEQYRQQYQMEIAKMHHEMEQRIKEAQIRVRASDNTIGGPYYSEWKF